MTDIKRHNYLDIMPTQKTDRVPFGMSDEKQQKTAKNVKNFTNLDWCMYYNRDLKG